MSSIHRKIGVEQLKRRAVVYVRQSSMKQVRDNLESQRLQYGLAERARKLGWEDIEIIDADLGVSASAGSTRAGFERLVASVALGEVGIVLSREVSRLSRNDKDWCHLIEVCQAFGTLIGDEDQVYDLDLMDDQLVLGIKGTMSVVELKVLKMRMLQGKIEKARRGDYFSVMVPGYVLDGNRKVVFDPDERVRDSIALVFRKFRELWSARQTYKWFANHSLQLPVNKYIGGKVKLVWQVPKPSFIQDMLSNSFYAGAYTYGRGTTEVGFKDGQLVKKRSRSARRPEECEVFIQDHHEGYISWQTYEENRERMSLNCCRSDDDEPDPQVAAVRAGQGLLAGLLRCAHCGRKLHVRYWGRSGTAPRYQCVGTYHLGGDYCISFGGARVDQRLAQEIVQVISPLGIQASLEALERLRSTDSDRRQSLLLELRQVDYEVQRAHEQYDQADPRNRLVVDELERRWNEKMKEREAIRKRIANLEAKLRPLRAEDENRIRALGEDFACVWEDETCPIELKKKIAHTLIEEIVVRLEDEELHLVVHWKGGTHTQIDMLKPTPATRQKTSLESLEIIRKMAVRYGDGQIASVLNRLGHRTGKDLRWTVPRVADARRTYDISGQVHMLPDPNIFSLSQAAKYCEVPASVIRRLVKDRLLKNGQVVPSAPWELKRAELDSEPVQRLLEKYKRSGNYNAAEGCPEGQLKLNV